MFLFHLKFYYMESVTNVLCPVLLGDNTAIFYSSALAQFAFHITVQQFKWERVHMVSSFLACVCSQEKTTQKERHSSSMESPNNIEHSNMTSNEWMSLSPHSLCLRVYCGGLPVLVNHWIYTWLLGCALPSYLSQWL